MEYIAFVHKEGDQYIATIPDLNYTSSFGDTFKEAVRNIKEAGELYCEGLDKLPKARELEALLEEETIEQGDVPQLVDFNVEKLVRINIMIRSDLLKKADQRAGLEFKGNRSAYIQNLVARDASGWIRDE